VARTRLVRELLRVAILVEGGLLFSHCASCAGSQLMIEGSDLVLFYSISGG